MKTSKADVYPRKEYELMDCDSAESADDVHSALSQSFNSYHPKTDESPSGLKLLNPV